MTVRPPLVLSILAVWLGIGAVPPGARSAEAEATSAAPGGEAPLRIRKIEAPENLLQDWPFDQVRWLARSGRRPPVSDGQPSV